MRFTELRVIPRNERALAYLHAVVPRWRIGDNLPQIIACRQVAMNEFHLSDLRAKVAASCHTVGAHDRQGNVMSYACHGDFTPDEIAD
jgi:hypothetical protein